MKAAAKALREAFEDDRIRQMLELHRQIRRIYGMNASDQFQAFLWWGWRYNVPPTHLPYCKCPLHDS